MNQGLKLDRPLVCFDLETTGTNVATDRIVQFAGLRVETNESVSTMNILVNPGRTMTEDNIDIHGITNAMVADKPPFKAVAQDVIRFVDGADLVGYNLRNFDVPMLWEELHRNGINWAIEQHEFRIIDAATIFQKKEPRDLTAAVRKYCGREHLGAHDAMADVKATLDVLYGQREAYPDLATMSLDARWRSIQRETSSTALQRNAWTLRVTSSWAVTEFRASR